MTSLFSPTLLSDMEPLTYMELLEDAYYEITREFIFNSELGKRLSVYLRNPETYFNFYEYAPYVVMTDFIPVTPIPKTCNLHETQHDWIFGFYLVKDTGDGKLPQYAKDTDTDTETATETEGWNLHDEANTPLTIEFNLYDTVRNEIIRHYTLQENQYAPLLSESGHEFMWCTLNCDRFQIRDLEVSRKYKGVPIPLCILGVKLSHEQWDETKKDLTEHIVYM